MKSTLLLFVAVTYFATGESLKCYECKNPPDAGCNDPFDKNAAGVKIIECHLNAHCAKLSFKRNSEIFVARGCHIDLGPIQDTVTAHINATAPESAPTISYCDEDYCNGASSIAGTLSILMVLATIPIIRSCY